MQITGFAVYTVIFSLIILSINIRIYKQVMRNKNTIDFLLSEWQKNKIEKLRKNQEKCQQ